MVGLKSQEPLPFIASVRLCRERVPCFDAYPFSIPAIRHLQSLEFHRKVTFLVGENGTGKSTLLEVTKLFLTRREKMLEDLMQL